MRNLPTGREIPGGSANYASVQCASGAESLNFASLAAANTLLAITGSDFVFSGSAGFALTPAGGILTYTGDTIIVQARAIATMMSVDDGAPGAAYLVFSLNGAFIGEAPFSDAQIAAGFTAMRHDPNNAGGSRIFNQSCARQLTLESGDTLQVVGGNNQAVNLTINAISILLNQVG